MNYQYLVYNVCEKMDVVTLTAFLNNTTRGIDWSGSTKKDMLDDISKSRYRLDKLTEDHIRIATLLLDEQSKRKQDVTRAKQQFRRSVRAMASHIGRQV